MSTKKNFLRLALLFLGSGLLLVASCHEGVSEAETEAEDISIPAGRLSVIIPCYPPHMKFLESLLDNLNEQTVPPGEVIIALSQISNKDSNSFRANLLKSHTYRFNLRVIPTEKKQLAGENRNRGAAKATGDYLMFVDSDDYYHKEKIEITLKVIEKLKIQHGSEPNLILHSFFYDTPNKRPKSDLDFKIELQNLTIVDNDTLYRETFGKPLEQDLNKEQWMTGNDCIGHRRIPHGIPTVKRSVFDRIQYTSKDVGEDVRFCRDILWSLGGVYFIDVALMIYSKLS